MHSRITLVLPHHPDHRVPPPVIELHDGDDREARITFREADDECAEMVGCPECLARFLRSVADVIETRLAAGDARAGG